MADSTSGGDCAGAVVNGGYNLIEDGSCITEASSISGDPALLPLADNGGPTQTFLPSDTSPAIDRITAGFLDCGAVVSADQRGVERPAASFCDSGAVEVFPSPNAVCFVESTGDGVTDYAGTDAGALRDAVNAAPAGSTLKVAGTCAGTANNRVVYIDTDLTIVGGYDSSDWSAPPDSMVNPTVLDAQQGGRVAVIAGNAQVTLRHLTLRNGLVSGDNFGGAILVNTDGFLSLEDSRIEESQTSFLGGAIFNDGPVEIIRSTLSNNQASAGGGAIYARADLTIRASTFANNTATGGDGGAIVQDGGAIDILNSTFSGNNANNGGAISSDSDNPLTVRYSTFSGNGAGGAGGAIRGDSTTKLIASILADSTGGGECAGAVVDGGYNLIEDSSCITEGSWSISGDPALLPLADNGGPTQTHVFALDSTARDRIPQGVVECGQAVVTDQRLATRPTGSSCDVGATEYVPAQPAAADDTGNTDEDAPLSVPAPGVLANDSDPNGDPLTVELITGPISGTLSLRADGAYVYTPTLNFNGTDSFRYRISDGNLTDSATVTLQVASINDAPTALDDERYAAIGIQSVIDVLRNDSDAEGDVLTIVSVSDPPKGAAVIDNNRVLYTPDSGAGSVDTFTYAVSDGQETRSAQVTVTTFQADLSGACTAADDLIAAINSANLDPDPDTITLAPDCTYSLTTYVDFNPDDYGPVGLPPVDSDITIVGNGAIIERAGNAENDFRLFYVTEDGDLTLERLHLRGGIAQGGNGIRFTGNTGSDGPGGHGGGAAGLGGAIFNRGSVTILESTLSDNHAKGGGGRGFVTRGRARDGGGGGGMAASATNRLGGPGGGGDGGILWEDAASNGGFGGGGGGSGYQSSMYRNRGGDGGFGGGGGGGSGVNGGGHVGGGGAAGYGGGNGNRGEHLSEGGDGGNGGGGAGMGGAIFNWHGAVSLVNSTLTGNLAQGGSGGQGGRGLGGALFNGAGTVEIVHSTLAGNIVQGRDPAGGAVFNYQNESMITLRNSILADSSGGNDCANDGGTITAPAPDHNLIETVGDCPNPATTSDPGLLPLADYYGGDTPTLALTEDSLALNAIPEADCLVAVDQRGVTRPQFASCDIGAYELEDAPSCWVERTGDETPDHVSLDASAIQAAIDAAAPDSLLKIAGFCAGVTNADGRTQTAYVDKALTLRGGYTTADWSTSDPVNTPTVLDALGQGRVLVVDGGASVQVENLTIRGGQAASGAGLLVESGASLFLENSLVTDNVADVVAELDGGGGLGNRGQTVIRQSTFTGNRSQQGGGAANAPGASDAHRREPLRIDRTMTAPATGSAAPSKMTVGRSRLWPRPSPATVAATAVRSTTIPWTAALPPPCGSPTRPSTTIQPEPVAAR